MRPQPSRALVIGLLLAFGTITVGVAGSASAATLVSSSPADGATISTALTQVTVTADRPLAEMGNSILVTSPDGTRVDDGSVQPSGSTALVGVKELTATGVYTVAYQLFLADGQNLAGTYTFNFTGSASPTSTPSTASPTPTKTFPPQQQHNTFFDRMKGGGIGLLLVALILIVVGSRFAASRSNRD